MNSGSEPAAEAPFPRGVALPSQSPFYWAGQKDRYLRQLLIRDIEAHTQRRLVVYFANRFNAEAGIDAADPAYFMELLGDIASGDPVDLLIETNGGQTDATEAIVSILQTQVSDLRVVVANAAKSNGTLICLTARAIVLGPPSELGPIDPQLGGVPCTILEQPQVAASNFPLHQMATLAIAQTRKLATRLLTEGMMKGSPATKVAATVEALATRNTYFSHGSCIDHKEAKQLGLEVEYLSSDDLLWQRIWMLYVMYDHDVRRDGLLKVFEGRSRSTAVISTKASL